MGRDKVRCAAEVEAAPVTMIVKAVLSSIEVVERRDRTAREALRRAKPHLLQRDSAGPENRTEVIVGRIAGRNRLAVDCRVLVMQLAHRGGPCLEVDDDISV